jgi:Glycosyl transferase family 2
MRMSSPKISVVMSVYNGEAYLAEAVESILAQTLKDFEFLIIDDGSTDRTAEILRGYAARDPRVRVFSQENRGRAESLNRGISLAAAPLIARMDADDAALPQRLERQLEFLSANPDVGLLGTGMELMSPEGRTLDRYIPPAQDDELSAEMLRGNPFRHPTILMRKEIAVAVGGYRKALLDADDYDLWLRMAERTKMANLGQPLLRYRLHANQATMTNMTHQVLCCWVARAAAALRREGLPDPLEHVEKITPELARQLGVNLQDVQRDAVAGHLYWIGVFAGFGPEVALPMIGSMRDLFKSRSADRSALAGALMRAARIHLRRRQFAKALASAGRAALVQPIETAHITRMAVARRMRNFRRHLFTQANA